MVVRGQKSTPLLVPTGVFCSFNSIRDFMFRSQHSYFGSVTCPGLLQNKRCSLPHCIFSHEVDSKKRPAEESELPETPAPKQLKNSPRETCIKSLIKQDIDNAKSAEVRVPSIDQKVSSSSLRSQSPKPTLSTAPNELGKKSVSSGSNSKSSASIKPQETQSEKQESLPARKLALPVHRLPQSGGIAKPVAPSVAQRVDSTSLVPTPVQPFAPATHDQRINFLKVIVRELEAKKVRYPRRVAMKLEYNIAKSSSKVIYPKNIRILVSDIQNNRFGKPGAEKAEAERQAKEAKLNAQLRDGLKELLIPTRFLESNEYVVGMVIPKPIEDDFVATCERCSSKFKPNGTSAQSTCYYHWARLPYDCM